MSTNNLKIIEEKINNILKNINFKKIKSEPKLLIISCSDKKKLAGNANYERNYFDSQSYNNLKKIRELRKNQYLESIYSEPERYNKKRALEGTRNKTKVDGKYFINSIIDNNNFEKAVERYEGVFYSNKLKDFYYKKNSESKLHILILSGLYGVLEFRDEITDYHFKINDGTNIWENELTTVLNQYISENKIDNGNVFFALSNEYLKKIEPNERWINLWINNIGKSRQSNKYYSANCVINFLEKL
jgi:cytoplasmic iron level regulating protein YaaA (DUF328/UPF0246 family)